MKINFPLKKNKPQKVESPGKIPKVSVFWSPLTVGKSLLSRTFARTLIKEYPGAKVCLLDFDVFTPSQPYEGFDLNQVAGMVFGGDFDAEYIIKNLSSTKQDIPCLGGLTELLSMDMLNKDIYSRLIDSARDNYEFVIIDTCREINLISTLTALDEADAVMVPVNNKEGCIRHTKRFLDFLCNYLYIECGHIKILKNLIDQQSFTEKDIEQLLEYPVICTCEQITSESITLDNLLSALTGCEQKKAN
ncbi:MAG: AAA family ATPase [Clostridiales bacterium]|nr:AAA family ATPase [Clostridiales bacterium]MCF8022675.1 AAA family ATPase [Clostridiales bacterium]